MKIKEEMDSYPWSDNFKLEVLYNYIDFLYDNQCEPDVYSIEDFIEDRNYGLDIIKDL